MNIAIVFFTYRNDVQLLKLALQGVERLRLKNTEDEITFFVVDDGHAPLEEVPAGVEYEKTYFDRKGNLNGVECISGMVGVYADIAGAGYDWVVKTDCDTYINDIEWLREQDAERVDYVGTCHVHDYGSGACYALSARGVEKVAAFLKDETVRKRCDIAFCEDRAICRMANICGMAVIKPCGADVPERGKLFHDWVRGSVAAFEDLEAAYAVDFKRCRWHTTPDNWGTDREKAVARMAEYAAYMAGK